MATEFAEAVETFRKHRAQGGPRLAVEAPASAGPASPREDGRLGKVLLDLQNQGLRPASDEALAQAVLKVEPHLLGQGESMGTFTRRVRKTADAYGLFTQNGTPQAHVPTDVAAPPASMSIGEAWQILHRVGPRDIQVVREFTHNTGIRLSTTAPTELPTKYGEVVETERKKKLASPGTLEPSERTSAEQNEIVSLLNRASKIEARLRRVDPRWWARLDRDKRQLSRFQEDSRQRLPLELLESFASLVGACELLVSATGITSRMT
jgi:hypothetical protein